MPPQQPERLLDVVNQTLSLSAHERSAATIQSKCHLRDARALCNRLVDQPRFAFLHAKSLKSLIIWADPGNRCHSLAADDVIVPPPVRCPRRAMTSKGPQR
jgi:hypothetical protein